MRTFNIIFLAISFLFASCKKEDVKIDTHLATVNLVNAISSYSSQIKMNFTGGNFNYADSKNLSYINYDGKYMNGALAYAIPANVTMPLIVTTPTDTTKPIFNERVNIGKGESYSLFVTGYPDAPTAFMVKDALTSRNDSTGIRMVNLSPNSDKLKVNIYWGNFSYQFTNLSYKDVTSFSSFPNNISEPYYIVEVRNEATDELYAEFFLDEVTRQKNITLIVRGLVYGNPALEVVRINH